LTAHQAPERDFRQQLDRLLEGRDVSELTPRELFSAADDDFWFWALTAGQREDAQLREFLPGVPEKEVQERAVGLSGDTALQEGFLIYRRFRQLYEAYRGEIGSAESILDFGCGWGRVNRFFLKDVDPDCLWGVDHYDKMIEICRATSRWGNFRQNKPFPPIEFEDARFDLVFCFSVFSHLSEDAARQWVEEFARILKPGGLLIATTRHRGFIEHCRELRGRQVAFFEVGISDLFRDTDAWLERYDRGEFCFDSSEETYGSISWYLGETCIPEEYVREHWSRSLEVLDYFNDAGVTDQNIIVGQR
jgi:SAM-dependent methyltransferase